MPDRRNTITLVALALVACGAAPPPPPEPPPLEPPPLEPPAAAAPASSDIVLSFKLDPRLHGPTYGGEVWVSPHTYMGASGQDTVEVRAEGVEANGSRRILTPDWIPSDPAMVTVSPERGPRVTILVKRAGESKLTVASPGLSKDLLVRARDAGGAIHVEIVQLATVKTAAHDRPARGPRPRALEGRKERLSYVLGLNLGKALRRRSTKVDERLVTQGVEDGLSGRKTLVTEEELQTARSTLSNDTDRKRLALRRASIPPKSKE